jgi:hypothetical protein
VLEQALVNVGKGVMCLETVVEEKGVEKLYISRKQDAEGALSKTQDHDGTVNFPDRLHKVLILCQD